MNLASSFMQGENVLTEQEEDLETDASEYDSDELKRGIYAIADADTALGINHQNSNAFLRKGTALFKLKRYLEAKDNFQGALAFNSENENLKTWVRKCEAELDLAENQASGSNSETRVGVSGQNSESMATAETNQSESAKENPPSQSNASTQNDASQSAAQNLPPSMPSGPRTRYDWYQTQTHVIVSIMLKKIKKEDVKIEMEEKSLSATVKLPTGSDYSLELDLAHQIQPEKSSFKVMSTKIEIKMKKNEEMMWQKLEGDGQTEVKQFNSQDNKEDAAQKYPTSSHYTRNWDKLVSEIKEEEKDEKLEGDAAVNQLFQKIYADGNEETKKAMMKSFYESGGTVLSTNWGEVAKDKVEVKPPDGMEYKKWEV
ncbi:hypothetical protein FSP39_007529 [Pinctada imbricata]|uniref:Suppressor of G2 allele of SKP1-like protein n=1 Tax=Pinctada imbricata TaxID=66713 RepID=A0AA89C8K9_PINIB|nr:hypothetical protein FSP39_007529 [Pinctada imbricata]